MFGLKSKAAGPSDPTDYGVYQVFTGGGTGSGFLIDPHHLVTNTHVVAPYREVAVEKRDRTRIKGVVRRVHPERDLAIVQLDEPLSGRILPLSDAAEIRAKGRVHILGYPIGLPLSLTEGVVSHPRQRFDDQFYLQTDAAINPGNSGGPMLDDQWRIVAVTTCKIDSADAVGFGIPVSDVAKFVAEFRAQTAEFGAQCPSCEELVTTDLRDCPNCGVDLNDADDFREFFDPPTADPLTEFVEGALQHSGVDPVLARDGGRNWSFRNGHAPIRAWCCCAEHLNFTSAVAELGSKRFDELFRHLLSSQHAPFSFDLYGRAVRTVHVVSMADVFTPEFHPTMRDTVSQYIDTVRKATPELCGQFDCKPPPADEFSDVEAEATVTHVGANCVRPW
jgi:serine protease Do